MGKSIRIVVEFKVGLRVPVSGASADELALGIRRVRDEMRRPVVFGSGNQRLPKLRIE